jgi:EpsI family protein
MPDGCMVGRGTIVVATERESLTVPEEKQGPLILNKLVLRHSEVREHVFYFFMTGDLITPSYSKMRLRLMTDYLRRKEAGAALVRFSIRTEESGEEMALKTIKDFIEHTAAILPAYVS